MSTLTESTEARYTELHEARAHEVARLRRNGRVATIVAVVLAIALVGFGIWALVGDDSTSDTELSDEMWELIDDYHAAWNDLDVDALSVVMTDGYVHLNAKGQFDRDEQIRQLSNLDEFGWHPMEGSPPPVFESSGDAVVTGDGPWHVALLSDSTGVEDERAAQGISLFTIVEDDGVLKITRHVYAG